MADQDKHSKTEEPTGRRLSDARDKGNIPRSKELSSSISLLTAIITLYVTGGYIVAILQRTTTDILGNMGTFQVTQAGIQLLILQMGGSVLLALLPFFLIMVLMGIVINFGQGGIVFSFSKLELNFGAIDPIKGFERIFSKDALLEGAKSLVKILIAGYIGYTILKDEVMSISYLVEKDLPGIFEYVSRLAFKIVLHVGGVMFILGILDLLYVKWKHMQDLRMTKQEVKDEARSSEGDPQIKGKIRSMRMAQARRRLKKIIPTADVIITNPTHYAVALKYDRTAMAAPTVLAKGVDFLALRIREIAKENKVMLVENRFLARELYAQVEEGQEIPETLYAAVAEVLAYVYGIKGKI